MAGMMALLLIGALWLLWVPLKQPVGELIHRAVIAVGRLRDALGILGLFHCSTSKPAYYR
jgi:hypothetical protein